MNPLTAISILVSPRRMLAELSESRPQASAVFIYALSIGIIPPLCAYVGVTTFGWRFGVGEPVQVTSATALVIAAAYYLALLAGFGAATGLCRWMAPTYGASTDLGRHATLIAVVGTPLMAGGLLHLYPLLPLNLMLLIPALVFSCYLLYTGLPMLLEIDVPRGMLMASSMLGVFFAAALALAALTMILWTLGLGPDIGFDWRSSVAG